MRSRQKEIEKSKRDVQVHLMKAICNVMIVFVFMRLPLIFIPCLLFSQQILFYNGYINFVWYDDNLTHLAYAMIIFSTGMNAIVYGYYNKNYREVLVFYVRKKLRMRRVRRLKVKKTAPKPDQNTQTQTYTTTMTNMNLLGLPPRGGSQMTGPSTGTTSLQVSCEIRK